MSQVANYFWTYKRGSVGKVLEGQLRDANGPFEITGTLKLTAKKPRSQTPALNAVTCTPDPDQVTNKGNFTFTVDSTAANLPAGNYCIEFTHTDGGIVSVWPDDVNPNKTYGTLVVTEPLT